ncbi:MAG: SDR family oxidoreductase [Bacteroidetes bacterium]|nr:SDR family oxidoreductase [Bacteroidota bacterium]
MNYTLITGASKGIGKAFAHECASRGMNLILVARSGHLLEEVAQEVRGQGVQVHTFAADLLDHAVHKKVFEWIEEKGLAVNMLINNAGMGFYGKFNEGSLEKQLEMMHLNMDSMIKIAHEFLRHSDPNQPRYLLNTSSAGAFQPVPFITIYSATKSFIFSFSLGIRHELRKQGVHVTAFCPGGIESDFFGPAQMEEVVKKNARFMQKPGPAVKIAMDGLLKNKAFVIPGLVNKAGAIVAQIFPYSIVVPTAARLYDPDGI